MIRSCLIALLSSSILFACGSHSPGSASVSGTAAGVTVAAREAMAIMNFKAAHVDPNDGTTMIPDSWYLSANLTDRSNLCEELDYRNQLPNETAAGISLQRKDGEQISPGTYPVSQISDPEQATGVRALGWVFKSDDKCKAQLELADAYAKSGTVTITRVTKTELAGSFELTFASGSLKGTFTAPFCREFNISEIQSSFTCLP